MISRLFLSQDPKQPSWSKVLWQWIPWVNYISLSKGVLKLQFLYWFFLHPAKIDRETQFPLFILLFSSELYHPYETFLLILTLSLFIPPEIEIFFQPFNHFHSLSHKLLCSNSRKALFKNAGSRCSRWETETKDNAIFLYLSELENKLKNKLCYFNYTLNENRDTSN